MRALKFRAWDERRKAMALGFLVRSDGAAMMEHEEGVESYEDLIIEQFTGLVDKNGKDIFEGDIIRDHSFEQNLLICFGVYDNECFYEDNVSGNGWYSKDKHGEVSTLYDSDDYEVVGNLHANPELMT